MNALITCENTGCFDLGGLSDEALLTGTRRLVASANHTLAALLAHLAEVEARGVHRVRACASLYTYCIYELRMSEDAAFRRAKAARLCRRLPALYDAVAAGELHLTGLLMLGPHLTEDNCAEVLARHASDQARNRASWCASWIRYRMCRRALRHSAICLGSRRRAPDVGRVPGVVQSSAGASPTGERPADWGDGERGHRLERDAGAARRPRVDGGGRRGHLAPLRAVGRGRRSATRCIHRLAGVRRPARTRARSALARRTRPLNRGSAPAGAARAGRRAGEEEVRGDGQAAPRRERRTAAAE